VLTGGQIVRVTAMGLSDASAYEGAEHAPEVIDCKDCKDEHAATAPHLQLQCVFIGHEAEGANPCSIFRQNLTDLRASTTRVALSAATQLANDDQTVECVAPA
tara:strand:- start:258 stop:566 length:309 start_codon:yes stop_codon:yes gene_type:complete